MAKQKVVLRLPMENARKKSKALEIAGRLAGVTSVSLEEGDRMVVVGDGLDSIALITTLRKKLGGYAELVSVSPVGANQGNNPGGCNQDGDIGSSTVQNHQIGWPYYPVGLPQPPHIYEIPEHNYGPACCIIM